VAARKAERTTDADRTGVPQSGIVRSPVSPRRPARPAR
jgi:hypothetical protein